MWDGGVSAESSQKAKDNFDKITPPPNDNLYDRIWLRSPGNTNEKAAIIFYSGSVFQATIKTEYGLVYPALWVKSDIFSIKSMTK
jgi:hypothetical protein